MASALDILDDLAPISELSNGRTSALLQRADHDPVILIKRNKPSYVLMNIGISPSDLAEAPEPELA